MSIRCSRCCEMGHNRRTCDIDSSEAAEMRKSYERVQKLATRANTQRVLAIRRGDLSEVNMSTEVIDSRDRDGKVIFMLHEREHAPSYPLAPLPALSEQLQPVSETTNLVPEPLVKIQDILFENSQDIPEGLYMQLMDAMVIKG
mgnify:CR=1 FL=1